MRLLKNLIGLSFCVIFSHKLNAQDAEKITLLRSEILNGNIKVLTEQHVYTNRIDTTIYFFNEFGLIAEKKRGVTRVGETQKTVYTYNLDGKEIKISGYDNNEKKTFTTEFTYEDGNLIKRITNHPSSTSKITYYFDYDVIHYRYDKNRNLIEKKELSKRKKSKQEELKVHNKYQYDSIGNCIIEENLDRYENVWKRQKYEYLNGRLVETFTWQKFEEEDLYLRDIYEYNVDGTMKSHKHIVYAYGGADEKEFERIDNYLYEYDIKGLLIKKSKITTEERFFPEWLVGTSTKETTWQYNYRDFDEKGNWGQRTTVGSDVGNTKIVREIEYY
jgi:hypothetical protein